MVKRKLPKAELRRYIRDTPFTHDEVQKLWGRFTRMDADATGQLNYQVRLAVLKCYTAGGAGAVEAQFSVLASCMQKCAYLHAIICNAFAMHWQETAKVDELRCNPFSARIVYLFSEDGSGELTFQRFMNMMSVFSGRTSRQTKAVWAFALWDFDGALSTQPAVTVHSFVLWE